MCPHVANFKPKWYIQFTWKFIAWAVWLHLSNFAAYENFLKSL